MTLPDTRAARSAILQRLRSAEPGKPVAVPDVPAYYRDMPDSGAAERRARFIANARGWQAEVHETGAATWTETLADVIAAHGVRHLLAGVGTPLSAALAAAPTAARLAWYDRPIEALKDTLFDTIDAGITTARGGIAETGSLILWPDRHEPRTLSLVPPLHIAVLPAEAIHATLHHAMHGERWAADLPTNALLVTGPSKTADIQRLLVYGAHGPKKLVILVVHGMQHPAPHGGIA